jgi:uncharacterized protein YdeI (YjbR/CyaY-like superfamily)
VRNTDPRVDRYIEDAPDFSRPILAKLRKLFQEAYPDIGETIKWSTPTFQHKSIVGGMAAFKKHVAYGFWNAKEMKDPEGLFAGKPKKSPFALKATTSKDLPGDRVLLAYIKEAVRLNEQGVKRSPAKKTAGKKPAPRPPADLLAALKKNRKALATFEGFSPSRRREYVEWITEAKREATREKRIATAVEWLAEGKPRNWKYMKRGAGG